jgi:hypothetical protein
MFSFPAPAAHAQRHWKTGHAREQTFLEAADGFTGRTTATSDGPLPRQLGKGLTTSAVPGTEDSRMGFFTGDVLRGGCLSRWSTRHSQRRCCWSRFGPNELHRATGGGLLAGFWP